MRPATTFLDILYKLHSNLRSYSNCYNAIRELAHGSGCGLLPKNGGRP